MTRLSLFISILLLVCACTSQKNDKTDYIPYEAKAIGWTTKFPGSWSVMTEDEIARLEGRGKAAMESAIDQNVIMTHTNLLWLQKDKINSFTSNSQPFDSIAEGSFQENTKMLFQAIIETYKSKEIQLDVNYGTAKIDGLEFTTMEMKLFSPDRKKNFMNQIMYERLINGNTSLTLNINYDNDEDKAVLLDIIGSSKFLKRN